MNRERHKKFLETHNKKQIKIDADIETANKWKSLKEKNKKNSSELLNILVEKGEIIMKNEEILKEFMTAIEEDQLYNYGDMHIEEIDTTSYYLPNNDVWVFDAPWGSGWYYIECAPDSKSWDDIEPVWFKKRF